MKGAFQIAAPYMLLIIIAGVVILWWVDKTFPKRGVFE